MADCVYTRARAVSLMEHSISIRYEGKTVCPSCRRVNPDFVQAATRVDAVETWGRLLLRKSLFSKSKSSHQMIRRLPRLKRLLRKGRGNPSRSSSRGRDVRCRRQVASPKKKSRNAPCDYQLCLSLRASCFSVLSLQSGRAFQMHTFVDTPPALPR